MIKEATDLLSAFISEEKTKIAEFDMPHMPTLGEAYEEITIQAINKNYIIPPGLDLRVVKGFIKVGAEQLPNQIDCMLVKGCGDRFGLTDKYIYDVENVLAIFEVKKTLNKKDFIGAYEHLAFIRKKYSQYFAERMDAGELRPNVDSASDIYAKITGRIGPKEYDDIFHLDEKDQAMFYALVIEQVSPVIIIQGYGGYNSEKGLRSALIDYIDEAFFLKNLTEKQKELYEKKKNDIDFIRGVNCIPTLITANNYSLVKANGIPYIFAGNKKDEWALIASCNENPLSLMLELIWSKISLYCDVTMDWGNDDMHENLAPLLFAKISELNGQRGWLYRSFEISSKKLKSRYQIPYKPIKISKNALAIIRRMTFQKTAYLINDDDKEYFEGKDCNYDALISELLSTSHFAINDKSLYPIEKLTYIFDRDDFGFVDTNIKRLREWLNSHQMSHGLIHCINLTD